MNFFEEARAIRGMINLCSATQNEIAEKMGVSQSYVANKLRLLNFSDIMQKKITDSGISERHARALLRLDDEKTQIIALEKIKEMRLTVAESEALIENMLLDDMPKRINEASARDRIEKLEEIISAGVRNLSGYGIKVKKTTEFAYKQRYITLYIDER